MYRILSFPVWILSTRFLSIAAVFVVVVVVVVAGIVFNP